MPDKQEFTRCDLAKFYLNRLGWSVIPIVPGDKKALIKWEEFQKRKPTEKEIDEWWGRWSDANVAVVTGEISGICVVDIDTPEGAEEIKKYMPDAVKTPIQDTPRGGMHLFFKHPKGLKFGNNTKVIPGCDFRGNGGYVLIYPSNNGEKKEYRWRVKPAGKDSVEFAELPQSYINGIKKLQAGGTTTHTVKEEQPMFIEGRRDDDLFHTALCMLRGGMNESEVLKALIPIAKSCDFPKPGIDPAKELKIKIASAKKRVPNNLQITEQRNIAAEIRDLILQSEGTFRTTDIYNDLSLKTPEEKQAALQEIKRMSDAGLIERAGYNRGSYRIIDKFDEPLNFDDTGKVEEYPVILPLELSPLVEIYPKNIIVVSGEFNSGKTTFMLQVLRRNKDYLPIRFLSSEMDVPEFKKRFSGFRDVSMNFFFPNEMTEYLSKSDNFHDAISPDRLNIIDYLEVPEGEFYRVGTIIRNIYDKLKNGIALIAIQKRKGSLLGRGRDFTLEKARLGISLFTNPDPDMPNVAKITKLKFPKEGTGFHDGKECAYDIVEYGSSFYIKKHWDYHNLLTIKKDAYQY